MTDELDSSQIDQYLVRLGDWKLSHEGKRIRRDWKVRNFLTGLDFFKRVGNIAEEMQHHPDLHIENYKDVWIEIWTHTVNGLTAKDFELAGKIDAIEV